MTEKYINHCPDCRTPLKDCDESGCGKRFEPGFRTMKTCPHCGAEYANPYAKCYPPDFSQMRLGWTDRYCAKVESNIYRTGEIVDK